MDYNLEVIIHKFIPKQGMAGYMMALEQLYIIFLVSVPLSLLLYLVFTKSKKMIMVDLGKHKWLIKL